MKQNLVVLLADLFNLFEIHPAKCVCYPGMDQQSAGKIHKYFFFFYIYFINVNYNKVFYLNYL